MHLAPVPSTPPQPVLPVAVIVADTPRSGALAAAALGAAGFTLAAAAATGEPVAAQAGGDGTLIVLLPEGTGTERLAAIRKAAEQHAGISMIAAMPGDASSSVLRRALRSGADGIVLDGELGSVLAPTALAVAAGQVVVPRALRRQIAPRALSHREKQILGLVVLGYTNRQIADKLFVAESTVKTHLSSAFGKLDARSRSEAAALILDPEEGFGLGILAISTPVPASG